MPEPIEELFVRLGLDATNFVDAYEEALAKAVEAAGAAGASMAEALGAGIAEGMRSELISYGQDVAEMATAMNISMEDAAASMAAAGNASEETADQLVALGRAYQLDLLETYKALVQQANVEIENQGAVSKETAASLEALVAQMNAATAGSNQMAQAAASGAAGLKQIEDQSQKGSKQVGSLGKGLQTALGGLQSFATGIIAAYSVGKLLKETVQYLNEASEAAIRFSATSFQLEAAIRVNQRAFGESAGTIKEWQGFADGLTAKFGTATQEAYQLAAGVNRMTGDMGLSKDQMMDLANAAAALSVTTGTDATSALYRLTQYINTGFTRGLLLMGVRISEAELKAKALSMQIKGGVRDWTAQERIMVRSAALLDKLSDATADAEKAEGALFNRQEQLTNQWSTLKTTIGGLIAPLLLTIKEGLNPILMTALKLIGLVAAAFLGAIGTVVNYVTSLTTYFAAVKKAREEGFNLWESQAIGVATFYDEFNKKNKEMIAGVQSAFSQLGDEFGKGATAAELMAAEIGDAMIEIETSIDELVDAYTEAAEDIDKNFYKKLTDIDEQLRDDLVEASDNLGRDLRDIDEQSAEQRTQTIRDAQIEELRMREDHQLKLRQMERRYLFELEDAVRERDARKVLLLMRRYNTEISEENEQFRLTEQRRRQNLSRELADIERARQMKRALRWREYREEAADLQAQAQRRRDEARADRATALKELQEDMRASIETMLAELLGGGKISEAALKGIADALGGIANKSSGALRQIATDAYNYVKSMVQAASAAMNALAAIAPSGWSGMPGVASTANAPGTPATLAHAPSPTYAQAASSSGWQGMPSAAVSPVPRAYQAGGEFIATSPSLIKVGERPEHVGVTPLTGQGGAMPGFGRGGKEGGRVQVEIGLGNGLVGEIVDGAVSEVAEVVLRMTQAETTGFGGKTRVGGRQ